MDTIADFLIMMKNASMVGKTSVVTPFSNIKFEIAELLSKKGFVGKVSKKNKKDVPSIEVELLFTDGAPRITDVERISKPSRRLYLHIRSDHELKFAMRTFHFHRSRSKSDCYSLRYHYRFFS